MVYGNQCCCCLKQVIIPDQLHKVMAHGNWFRVSSRQVIIPGKINARKVMTRWKQVSSNLTRTVWTNNNEFKWGECWRIQLDVLSLKSVLYILVPTIGHIIQMIYFMVFCGLLYLNWWENSWEFFPLLLSLSELLNRQLSFYWILVDC